MTTTAARFAASITARPAGVSSVRTAHRLTGSPATTFARDKRVVLRGGGGEARLARVPALVLSAGGAGVDSRGALAPPGGGTSAPARARACAALPRARLVSVRVP